MQSVTIQVEPSLPWSWSCQHMPHTHMPNTPNITLSCAELGVTVMHVTTLVSLSKSTCCFLLLHPAPPLLLAHIHWSTMHLNFGNDSHTPQAYNIHPSLVWPLSHALWLCCLSFWLVKGWMKTCQVCLPNFQSFYMSFAHLKVLSVILYDLILIVVSLHRKPCMTSASTATLYHPHWAPRCRCMLHVLLHFLFDFDCVECFFFLLIVHSTLCTAGDVLLLVRI